MQIKPLHQATRTDITVLAHAAAERGEPSDQSNVFDPSSWSYRAFEIDYYEHFLSLIAPAEEVAA